MKDLEPRRAAVAFWTLLASVVVTVFAGAIGNLAPALLPLTACDALGLVALGLAFVAHGLPLAAGLTRLARPPVPLQLAGVAAGKIVSFQAVSSRK